MLTLLCYDKVFEIGCDVSGVGIGDILTKEEIILAFFSEKPGDSRREYSLNDKEFYIIV